MTFTDDQKKLNKVFKKLMKKAAKPTGPEKELGEAIAKDLAGRMGLLPTVEEKLDKAHAEDESEPFVSQERLNFLSAPIEDKDYSDVWRIPMELFPPTVEGKLEEAHGERRLHDGDDETGDRQATGRRPVLAGEPSESAETDRGPTTGADGRGKTG